MLVDYKVCLIAIAFASDKKDLQSLGWDATKIIRTESYYKYLHANVHAFN